MEMLADVLHACQVARNRVPIDRWDEDAANAYVSQCIRRLRIGGVEPDGAVCFLQQLNDEETSALSLREITIFQAIERHASNLKS